MPNPYGRPKTHNFTSKVRLPKSLLPRLVLARPELFKHGEYGVFKYGAFSQYVTRLIVSDLNNLPGATLDLEELARELGNLEGDSL